MFKNCKEEFDAGDLIVPRVGSTPAGGQTGKRLFFVVHRLKSTI